MEPGAERGVVVEVLDGQPYHGNSAALPLQVAVTVIDVASRAAMVGPVDLHDQDTSPAHYQDVGAPGIACTQADTGERSDRNGL
jgi:hypothetical protein